MTGHRKILALALGLLALAGAALVGLHGGLVGEPLRELLSGLGSDVVYLVAAAMGGNALEHWSKRDPGPKRSQAVSENARGPVVDRVAAGDAGGGT